MSLTVVTARKVKRSFAEMVEAWMPATLAEVCRVELGEYDPEVYKAPVGYANLPDQDAMMMNDDQFPMVAVTSPGLAEVFRDEDGAYSAKWLLNLFVLVRDESFEKVSDSVALYTAALRMTACQHRVSISGAKKAVLRQEQYDVIDTSGNRTLGGGRVEVTVEVQGIMDDTTPASTPPEAPDFEWPDDETAETVNVAVDSLD